jgi:regulatory protein
LEQVGLLDDVKFAAFWVDQRQTFSPRGARALRAELAAKGVASALIDSAVQPARDAEDDLAYRAAARQARRKVSVRGASEDRWLMAYLERRGFGATSIRSAITRLATEAADAGELDDSALERG